MDSELNCKHHRIPRNCYLCYLHRHDNTEGKTILDTLHETLSQLKIRIAKLEEYKRLQDDNNKEVNKCIFDLNDFMYAQIQHNNISAERLKILEEHRQKQIDENRAVSNRFDAIDSWIRRVEKDLTLRVSDLEKMNQNAIDASPIKDIYARFAKIESKLTMNKWHEYFTSIGKEKELQEYIDAIATGEKLLSKIKTTGLTFEEAIVAFKAGKTIRMNDGCVPTIAYDHSPDMDYIFRYADICRDHWEIVE